MKQNETKLKRIISLLLLTQLLWLGACNKSDVTEIKNDNLLSEAEIKDIGVKHNESLDFVFGKLLEMENSTVKSGMDYKSVIKEGLRAYCEMNYSGEELQNIVSYSEKQVDESFSSSKTKSSADIYDDEETILKYIQDNPDQFSKTQIKYLLKCESILKSENEKDLNIILTKLNLLESSIKNELCIEEAQVVLVYLEIARASIQYWENNYEKWVNQLSESKTKGFWSDAEEWWKKTWRVTKEIAVYDAVGGGGAASGALIVNVVPGAGQVAYGSAIIVGASSASAVGAYEVYKKYTCEITMKVPLTIESVLENDENLCMVNVNDLSLIETYSDENIDLSNVALYVDLDLYFRVAQSPNQEGNEIYLYAFCPDNYQGIGEPLSMHLDEIENKSMEIKRILVGSTSFANLKVKRRNDINLIKL